MGDGAQTWGETDCVAIEPPRWSQCLMALAGIVLLIGPTLAVLWPR